jgi:hypothetical protein
VCEAFGFLHMICMHAVCVRARACVGGGGSHTAVLGARAWTAGMCRECQTLQGCKRCHLSEVRMVPVVAECCVMPSVRSLDETMFDASCCACKPKHRDPGGLWSCVATSHSQLCLRHGAPWCRPAPVAHLHLVSVQSQQGCSLGPACVCLLLLVAESALQHSWGPSGMTEVPSRCWHVDLI